MMKTKTSIPVLSGLLVILFSSLSFPQQDTLITSTWNGGEDPWFFNQRWTPPIMPNNSVTQTFNVQIDGGNQVSSNVIIALCPPLTISKLKIDSGDSLIQEDMMQLNISEGEVINNGEWKLKSRQWATFGILTDTLLTGTGILDLKDNANLIIANPFHTMTIGPEQTILGGGHMASGEAGKIIILGTVLNNGQEPFIIQAGEPGIENSGIISSTGSGGISLTNGIVNNHGTIEAGDGSSIGFENAWIYGGNLASHGTGKIIFSYNTFLDNITLVGNAFVPISSTITVTNVLTDTGQMILTPTSPLYQGPILVFGNGAVITHTGEIVMGDPPVYTGTIPITDTMPFPRLLSNGVFTQGSHHTIRGGGILLGNSGGMLNQGAIVADGENALTINPGNEGFFNSGPITVTSPAGLVMMDGLFANSYIVTTTLSSKSENLAAASPSVGSLYVADGSKAVFQDVQVLGGNFKTGGSGKLIFTHNSFLENIWITGTSIITETSSITYSVSLTHTGDMILTSTAQASPPAITFTDGTVLTGTGTIFMVGHPDCAINTTGIFTQTIPHSIEGGGKILNSSGGMKNEGTIIAQGNHPLIITPDQRRFINSGTLKSNGPAGLMILNAQFFENQGIVEIGENSSVDIIPAYTQTYGATILNEGSSLKLGNITGNMYLGGGELSGKGLILGKINNQGGSISPGVSAGCMTIVGALTNTGEMVMEIGGRDSCEEFDSIFISGTVAFGGTLDLQFTDGFVPNLTDTFPIMSYNSRTNEFDILNVSGLPDNKGAYLEYGAHLLEVKIQEKGNEAPQMQILEPSEDNEISTTTFVIRWIDQDPDDDALISLYYSPYITAPIETIIVEDLSEDDEGDFYVWDTTLIPEGIYWIHAWITDEVNSPFWTFSLGSIKVSHVTKQEIIDHLLSQETFPQIRRTFADFNSDGIIDIGDLVYLIIITHPD